VTGQGVRTAGDEVHAALVTAKARVGLVGAVAVILAATSMRPLLDGAWWFPRTVAMVLAVAAAGAVARALRLPAPLQPILQAATLLVSLTLLFAREEARWGFLPGPAALGRLRDLAAQGRAFSEATVPPAGADEGLLLLIVAGVGLIALAVDTLAAGLDLPGLTLVPLASLFLVPWAIGGGSAPWWSFVAVAVGWFAILSATQRDRAALWSPEARPGSAGGGMLVATATTVLALAAGGLVALGGPVDPVRIGGGIGSGSGTVQLDALVSLRRSLVSQDDRVVLTYASTVDRPDYLRLAVLEEFDGEQWLPAATTSLGPQPPSGPAGGAGSAPLAEYRLDIGPLTGTTLPSPTGTIQSLNNWPVVWDQRTSLPLRGDGSTIEGERIGLVVAPATPDATTLRAASLRQAAGFYPEDVADPEPLVGPELPELAREITAGAASPFDAAIALQRWFTSEGDFAYSTQVQGGAGEDALTTFLTERVGYCEQFSATMALMARAIGIPARVVVGFTQGREDGTLWVVRGTDAHAWPELWMGSAGWVRFEPTPGAPTTTTPAYTSAGAQPTAAPSAPTDEQTTGPDGASTDTPAQVPEFDGLNTGAGGQQGAGFPLRWVVAAIALLLVLLPGGVRLGRRRRRMSAADGEAAYREVADSLLDLRLGAERATPRETMAEVWTQLASGGQPPEDEVEDAMRTVLGAVEVQRYAPPPPMAAADAPTGSGGGGVAVAQRASVTADVRAGQAELRTAARRVRRALARRAGWPRRIRGALLPQSVLSGLGGPAQG
jgi:transglutaminase-like putative cysteine protease